MISRRKDYGYFEFLYAFVFLFASFIKIIVKQRFTIEFTSKVPSVMHSSPSNMYFFFLNT